MISNNIIHDKFLLLNIFVKILRVLIHHLSFIINLERQL